MKAFFFWENVGGLTLEHWCNPYAGLLARALERQCIHLELGDYTFDRHWLESNRNDHQVLHLNWLHFFYRTDTLETTRARYAGFAENLTFARRLGYRIVWTMHNRYPHERPFPEVDHLARLLVSRLAHTVIAHCNYSAGLARTLFLRTGDVRIIPHGHFIEVFQNKMPREEARRDLGIPQSTFVYLFFGNARTYRGIEGLIEAFCRAGDADARLLMMMRRWPRDPKYADKVIALAGRDGRILVFSSPYFPNEAFQVYLNASDVVVLPFSDVLTSGTAITALSFGKPVILPRVGCLPELIDDTMGILYDPGDKRGLEEALAQIRGRDLEAAGRSALSRARALDWDGIAAQVRISLKMATCFGP